jgi:hypothetical protein
LDSIDYANFALVSFLIYFIAGYWGAYHRGVVCGVFLAAWGGVIDSTIGWFVSRMIGPFFRSPVHHLTPIIIASAIFLVIAIAAIFGAIGAGVCKILGQTERFAS